MIVCLCRRVSDRDIRATVQAGVTEFEVMLDRTGAASNCGCCHDCAREVFDAARSDAAPACPGLCHRAAAAA